MAGVAGAVAGDVGATGAGFARKLADSCFAGWLAGRG